MKNQIIELPATTFTDLYTHYGFVPVAWVQWDDAQAPASWDYNKYGRSIK